jgi:hypothetical protein
MTLQKLHGMGTIDRCGFPTPHGQNSRQPSKAFMFADYFKEGKFNTLK